MRRLSVFVVGLLVCRAATVSAESGRFAVVGYLPDYRVAEIALTVADSVTDIVYFSIEPRATGEIDTDRLTPTALEKLQQIKHGRQVNLLIALGGWGRCDGFAAMATDPLARARFVKNLSELCEAHRFDGVDFDWEYPTNKAEEDAFATLLVETRQALRPKGRLVTAALSSWQNLDLRAFDAVDRIHLMAYEDEGPRHSTFEQAKMHVETIIKRGAPRNKICLGLPFFGRNMADRKIAKSYAQLVAEHHPSAETDEVAGVYFNGRATIERKVRFAAEEKLAGVMIWELGQDTSDDTSLLRAINVARPK